MTQQLILAQLNFTAGQVEQNYLKILKVVEQYNEQEALIVFPELCLTGYPCRDLLFYNHFISKCWTFAEHLKCKVKRATIVIGLPILEGHKLMNAAVVLHNGQEIARHYKNKLPNYGPLDEPRYFATCDKQTTFEWNGQTIAIAICEDMWQADFVAKIPKCDLLLSLNSSPYAKNKLKIREDLAIKAAKEHHCHVLYANLVGAEDEMVYDGHSFVVNASGALIKRYAGYQEVVDTVEFDVKEVVAKENVIANVYEVVKLGLQDYINKNNIKSVIVGSSGGIDSAVTLCMAVEAIGAKCVQSVMLPYQYTDETSKTYAQQLANNLGINHREIPIATVVASIKNLHPDFSSHDTTMQNIQSRARAIILMALSNAQGHLVLATGNKSEIAVGYATLYGDMCGGYAPIKDLYKTEVYQLAAYINASHNVIPIGIIEREPTAELKPNQTDQQSLPPYDQLDAIIHHYVEQKASMADFHKLGIDVALAESVIKKMQHNEFKRKQGPIGPIVSNQSFGSDWRFPLHPIR